jgi:hypothetical protein
MATVNQVFQSAPMGRRVTFATAFTFAALFVVFAVNFYVSVTKMPRGAPFGARIMQMGAPLLPIFILIPGFVLERSKVSRFSIEENVLVLAKKRYPLEGLMDAVRDPEVLKRARKRFGNGGLGSIRGKFVSKRLGKFDTFLTGTENAVVLRWPDKVVAVSPADPEFFIYSARAAAGLS